MVIEKVNLDKFKGQKVMATLKIDVYGIYEFTVEPIVVSPKAEIPQAINIFFEPIPTVVFTMNDFHIRLEEYGYSKALGKTKLYRAKSNFFFQIKFPCTSALLKKILLLVRKLKK